MRRGCGVPHFLGTTLYLYFDSLKVPPSHRMALKSDEGGRQRQQTAITRTVVRGRARHLHEGKGYAEVTGTGELPTALHESTIAMGGSPRAKQRTKRPRGWRPNGGLAIRWGSVRDTVCQRALHPPRARSTCPLLRAPFEHGPDLGLPGRPKTNGARARRARPGPAPPLPCAGALEEEIWRITIQTFCTLTEVCQGPCPENQETLVSCNVTRDVNEVLRHKFLGANPLLVFELRDAATLTLLSLLEGCNDASRPNQMVGTIDFASVQRILDSVWDLVNAALSSGYKLPSSEQALLDLAFNLFILLHHLSTFSDDTALCAALYKCSGHSYFQSLLGMVEIARGERLEVVYFHIPNIGSYLTEDLRIQFLQVERRDVRGRGAVHL